jgi:SAM-dependent methyltransferase
LAETSANGQSPRFCDYEGSDYRTAFWEGKGREYEDRAERIALRRLLPPTGNRLIDIGGGFGRLVDLYTGYRQVVLMDPSKSQLEYACSRLGTERITCVAASVYEMPFVAGAFDTAVTVRVLHHLSDVPRALQAIQHILHPDATFVLEYANKRNLKAILRYWLGRQKNSPFDTNPWEFLPLNFDFHPAYMERSLCEAHFSIEQQLSVSHLRVGLLKRLIPAAALASLDGWLQQPLAPLKLTPSVFMRVRTRDDKDVADASGQLFCCPTCRSIQLRSELEALVCQSCGRRWSTEGGIYDFKQPLN